jgi:hypothetical protein
LILIDSKFVVVVVVAVAAAAVVDQGPEPMPRLHCSL